GELEHRRLKRFYAHTNKNAKFVSQIAKHQRRERFVNKAHKQAPAAQQGGAAAARQANARLLMTRETVRPLRPGRDVAEIIEQSNPGDHHAISSDQRTHMDITGFVHDNEGDPAVKNFARDLRVHLFQHLHTGADPSGADEEYEPSFEDLAALRIRHNRMYVHKRMLVNYTSYDM
ncbi:hypothetical protein BC628DRAFT_1297070, partial [Trametes gibbosa]